MLSRCTDILLKIREKDDNCVGHTGTMMLNLIKMWGKDDYLLRSTVGAADTYIMLEIRDILFFFFFFTHGCAFKPPCLGGCTQNQRSITNILAATREKIPSDMCVKQRLKSEFSLPKKHWIIGYPYSVRWRFWSDCANVLADLNLRWLDMSEDMLLDVAAHCISNAKFL